MKLWKEDQVTSPALRVSKLGKQVVDDTKKLDDWAHSLNSEEGKEGKWHKFSGAVTAVVSHSKRTQIE